MDLQQFNKIAAISVSQFANNAKQQSRLPITFEFAVQATDKST